MTNSLMARLRQWQQYGPYRPSRYKEAADRIEELEAALREIADGPRDVEKSYVSLLHELQSEARAALAKDSQTS